MTPEQIDELAALHAAGALDGPERESFERLLRTGTEQARQALAAYERSAAVWAASQITPTPPPPELKTRILGAIRRRTPGPAAGPAAVLQAGFRYLPGHESGDWQQARIPGAAIKVLFSNPAASYAVVLGKLDAGVRYPAHYHVGSEELFILSGDLHVGEHVLRAGDFHHADAGTSHGENFSVEGCTLLAVVHPSVLDDLGVVFQP